MKSLYTFITAVFVLAAVPFVSAQTKTITYQSKGGIKEVPANEAFYFTVEETGADNLITSIRYTIKDSTKVRQQTYRKQQVKGIVKNNLHGLQYEWHGDGTPYSETSYENGKPVGVHKYWGESGELNYIKKYNSDSVLDTLEAYHKNGKVRRIEIYKGDEMASGKVFDETGHEVKFFPMLQLPSYPGGEYAMQMWLAKNIKYPKAAQKAKAQGLVLVSFVVEETGKIINAEVIKAVHPDADAESLRVINSMPLWEPGLFEGKPAKVRFTVPIRFSL